MIAHMVLTVNERILLDHDLHEWQRRAPDSLMQYLKPSPEWPWVKSAMVVLADAALANASVNIHITTTERGWNMEVSR